MSLLTRNLKILWRTERLLAEAEWRRSSRQISILAVSGIFVFLALVMLNVAGFYWLSTTYSTPQAALCVALVDLTIAAILAGSARALKSPREVHMIRELRDEVMSELEADAESVQQQLIEIKNDVQTIGATVSKVASDPVGSLSPALLMPVIRAFTEAARSKRS
jgi:hypothetical protein